MENMDPRDDNTTTALAMSEELLDLNLDPPDPGLHFNPFEEPPPPMITSEGIVAQDITRKFFDAAASLEPGELIKDGYFTLFESVGALEVMDPKMDSGCLAPGESLDEDYDVTRPLLPSEVVGIIDQLLSLEMAWHLGYPLSQTLFTSVYIENMLQSSPETIQGADFLKNCAAEAPRDPMLGALRAYCLGVVKACCYVNERIKYEHSYEEEDFVTNTYNRSLLENIDRYEIRDEIVAARTAIHELRHTLPAEMADALTFRLEFRTAFLRAIELSELRSDPESLSLPWSQMQGVWEAINKSRHLGKPVPEAFSTKIQRRLASTMPPRPIVQPSPEETHEHFKKLIADGINVLNILNYADSQSLLNFVLTFQAQKPQPLVYIRALLQNFLFNDMVILGRLSIRQVLDDDLSIVVLPNSLLLDPANDDVEAPHHPRYGIAHQMELFRQRAAQSYLDIFRAFCQNRCRVRRTLFHSLQDWETVQIDAEEIDQLLQLQTEEQPLVYPPGSAAAPSHSLPLSSWAYHYKLRLMEWTVQLGFELDIYQPDELAGMYWYLSHLAQTRALHIERIRFFSNPANKQPPSTTTTSPTPPSPNNPQQTRSAAYLHLTSLHATTTHALAASLSAFYTALTRLHLLPSQSTTQISQAEQAYPYSTNPLRYQVRMKPFAPITLPPLPTYESFTSAVQQPDVSTLTLLDRAAQQAGRAKSGLEVLSKMSEGEAFAYGGLERWREGAREWLRAAVAVGVGVGVVRRWVVDGGRGGEGDSGKGLEVEVGLGGGKGAGKGGCHEWWVVPRVGERKG